MPAMAWAASGISSISHWTRTTAVTTSSRTPHVRSLQDDGHAHAAGDAERGQREVEIPFPELVRGGQDDAGARHPDRVAEGDGAAFRIEPVVVELQLAITRQHLCGEGLVELAAVEVMQGEAGLL